MITDSLKFQSLILLPIPDHTTGHHWNDVHYFWTYHVMWNGEQLKVRLILTWSADKINNIFFQSIVQCFTKLPLITVGDIMIKTRLILDSKGACQHIWIPIPILTSWAKGKHNFLNSISMFSYHFQLNLRILIQRSWLNRTGLSRKHTNCLVLFFRSFSSISSAGNDLKY